MEINLGPVHIGGEPFDREVEALSSREQIPPDDAHRALGIYLVRRIQALTGRYDHVSHHDIELFGISGFKTKLTEQSEFQRSQIRLEDALGGDYIGVKVEVETEAEMNIDPKYGSTSSKDKKRADLLVRLSREAPDTGKPLMELLEDKKYKWAKEVVLKVQEMTQNPTA